MVKRDAENGRDRVRLLIIRWSLVRIQAGPLQSFPIRSLAGGWGAREAWIELGEKLLDQDQRAETNKGNAGEALGPLSCRFA